jgi:hypothetical protein
MKVLLNNYANSETKPNDNTYKINNFIIMCPLNLHDKQNNNF